MQFIPDGPDIPNALLQAHEEGRVVFFCGAGVSRPAGLPGFEGLVTKLYEFVGDVRDPTEEQWLSTEAQYDRIIGHFEHRIQGGRHNVRRHLINILSPKLTNRGALTTHMALLTLASHNGVLRLITTNFDTLFENAIQKYALPQFPIYSEPPIRTQWNGLVYLHGRIPVYATDGFDHLILSDVDFGNAYLREAWAARFVAGLFHEYTVCFVGYSIDDPILRYMTAAYSGNAEHMFAFAPFNSGTPDDKNKQAVTWSNKHVIPILYDDKYGHRPLHRTIHVWASLYRDGVQGKERLVRRIAGYNPDKSSPNNVFFTGRMLWALSDQSGLPAKRFAEFNPAPSLRWLLDVFSETRFVHGDLSHFGVTPHAKPDDKIGSKVKFCLIRRYAPYQYAQPMALMVRDGDDTQWDPVMEQIARWLTRHLNDPELLLWITQWGDRLHWRWKLLVEKKLDDFAKLELDNNTVELNEIRKKAPNAIPNPQMRTLWRLMLAGRVRTSGSGLQSIMTSMYRWKPFRTPDGLLTVASRLQLRELLAPKVFLEKALNLRILFGHRQASDSESSKLREVLNWHVVLSSDDIHSYYRDYLKDKPWWLAALPHLLADLQQLLLDALDLLRELGDANEQQDSSFMRLPSISPHEQNPAYLSGHCSWIFLIELLRDSWLEMRKKELGRASRIAESWFDKPYPTFKRLAFFAAAQDDCIAPGQWLQWLLADKARWLWSGYTKREVMRLFVSKGTYCSFEEQTRLEEAILADPPVSVVCYNADPATLSADTQQGMLDKAVQLRLARLCESGLTPGTAARERLTVLNEKNGKLADDESDEFPLWHLGMRSETFGQPSQETVRSAKLPPPKREKLVPWLRSVAEKEQNGQQGMDVSTEGSVWRQYCRRHAMQTGYALCDLAKEHIWPITPWRLALLAWSEKQDAIWLGRRTWRYFAPLLLDKMPDEKLLDVDVASNTASWLQNMVECPDQVDTIFLPLCHRILNLPYPPSVSIGVSDPVHEEAINHPVGRVVLALVKFWFKAANPNDHDVLPDNVEPFFKQLCDADKEQFRHGRIVLAMYLPALSKVARQWTKENLLPFFNWRTSTEARAMWIGFLYSPHLHPLLMADLKEDFLATAAHYDDLGNQGHQFAEFLTTAALHQIDGYSSEDFRAAFATLPQNGLDVAAWKLWRFLDAAGDQREECWKNRIKPFWQKIWPKSKDRLSGRVSQSLALLCLVAGDEFPAALAMVKFWLQPLENFHLIVDHFYNKTLPTISTVDGAEHPGEMKAGPQVELLAKSPNKTLQLLDAIMPANPSSWRVRREELQQCLKDILQAKPALRHDRRYQKLDEGCRRAAN